MTNTKLCKGKNGCNQWKPISDFRWHSRYQRYLPICRDCSTQSYIKIKRVARDGSVVQTTKTEMAELLIRQNYRCCICGAQEKLEIDHCHASNQIRGLLCKNCNGNIVYGLERVRPISRQSVADRALEYVQSTYMPIDRSREHPHKKNNHNKTQIIHDDFKQCNGRYGCGIWWPLNHFLMNKSGTYHTYCRACGRWKVRWTKYRITKSDAYSLIALQNWRCAVCLDEYRGPLNIDHDERRQVIRGILCSYCNLNLVAGLDKILESNRKPVIDASLAYLQ